MSVIIVIGKIDALGNENIFSLDGVGQYSILDKKCRHDVSQQRGGQMKLTLKNYNDDRDWIKTVGPVVWVLCCRRPRLRRRGWTSRS